MSTYTNLVQSLDPVAYWPLYDLSGTVGVDLAGANPGTYSNNEYSLGAAAPAALGNSLLLYGQGGSLDVPYFPISGSIISVVCWQFVKAADQNANGFPITKHPVNNQWQLMRESGSVIWRTGIGSEISTAVPSADTWHLLAATQNGSSAKLYIDNALVTSGTIGTWQHTNAGDIQIGRYSGGSYFKGRLCHVAIFDTELSLANIQSLYTAGLAAVPVTDFHPFITPLIRGRF